MNRKKCGGGVAFYVSEDISYKKIKELTSDELQTSTNLCENRGEKNIPTVVYKVHQKKNCQSFDQSQANLFKLKMQFGVMHILCADKNVVV